jgi:hypothetical protein
MSRLRTRLPHLLSLWATTAVVEAVLYRVFLRRPYFRGFFSPFAFAVLVAAVITTWRMLRPRQHGDRRVHDRRAGPRRGIERGAGE